MTQLSRREVLTLLTVAAAGASGLSPFGFSSPPCGSKNSGLGPLETAAGDNGVETATKADKELAFWRLIAPLQKGSQVAGFTLAAAEWDSGSMLIEMRGSEGALYQVRIFSKDESLGGPLPIARTQQHELFLMNGGHGATRTNEDIGLAVMALGNVLSRSESHTTRVATETIRERWAAIAV